MRTRLLYALLGAALALSLTFGAIRLRAQDTTYSGPKWEYLWYQMTPGHKFNLVAIGNTAEQSALSHQLQTLADNNGGFVDQFDLIGAAGWELVSTTRPGVVFTDAGADPQIVTFIFKRPAQ